LEELIENIRKKDALAMRYLYDRYAKEMLSSSYRITNDLMQSEDIIQEAFLRSFQKIDQLSQPQNYRAWLKKMVINASLKELKNNFQTSPISVIENVADDKDDKKPWYTAIKFEVIRQAIQNLPKGCRQIVSLYLFEDYKHREIAEQLGISVSTSKSQYAYGLAKLKDSLKKSIHE